MKIPEFLEKNIKADQIKWLGKSKRGKKWDVREILNIINLYLDYKISIIRLSKIYNVSHGLINQLIVKNGIKLLPFKEINIHKQIIINDKKQCTKCKEWKKIDNFFYRTKEKSYRSSCGECEKIKSYKYRQSHKKQERLRWLKYCNNHRTELNQYMKNKRKNDINFKLSSNIRVRIWNTIKGNSKSKNTMGLLGCSIDEFKQHLEKQFKPRMTWKNYGYYGWHIDHIRPCASFDLSDPKQQKQCFNYKNLQPLWRNENQSKNKKIL